ncbi:UvrD-helicase domain-containing protein [Actinocatenispora sera]|uniref:UvrD-helicase domain-containing protein n=1 Tax=Actinocatenispora sera TaxID=390989 RepID=UPI0033FBB5B2
MPRLGIDRDFLRDFAKMERPLQERIGEVFGKFREATHAGLHLEKVGNARDPRFRTIRIDLHWRGVVLAPEQGDTYTLLKVLPHDDAYAWAQRRRASVNAATGHIEIRDVAAIDATLPELSQHAERSAGTRVFAAVSDADLARLGVDDQTRAFSRALTEVIQLEAAQAFLPAVQYDVLYSLAAGYTPEQVWSELSQQITDQQIDPDDVSAAVARSDDQVLLVDGPAELMEVFRNPFDLWRIYLHPTQSRVVHARFSGAARVSGGPGTGKTVVCLHRAHQLALRNEGPILVTTFTSTLAASLRAGLDVLIDDPVVRGRITVEHVDRVANRIFRAEHGNPRLLSATEQRTIWRRINERLQTSFTEAFLMEEWRQVVLAQQVGDAAAYLTAKRTGRGRPLGRHQRAQVWQLMWEFQRELAKQHAWTYETLCAEATRLLNAHTDRPYRHVLVDEAQDLSAVQWRLVRAVAADGPDDVFLAGDTHQRIYSNRVTLRDVGLRVAGRSARLTVNYRTTAEILGWSLGMLRQEAIDDMEGGLESVAGSRSEVHGLPPDTKGYSTKDTELAAVAQQVKEWLADGVSPGEIGVAARTNHLAKDARTIMTRHGIQVRLLTEQEPDEQSVAAGTMHRMKGLEFRCLAVIGVSDGIVPPLSAITPASEDELTHQQDMQRERCLLFVACTRAREQLTVSWHGKRSPLLDFAHQA